MFCRDTVDVVFDLAVSRHELFGGWVFQIETRLQCVGGNQTDDESLGPMRIDMTSRKFNAARRRIENRDRIERQKHVRPPENPNAELIA